MRLARVLAKDGCNNSASALPAVDSPAASSSTRCRARNPACCSASDRSDAAASTSRDDHWSCGVCYEEICCPFSLPCGHTVCGNCLQQLLQFHARCPFCRLSVFQGCTFGRNVAMWNAIKAKHPIEAAQLASSSTVTAYQLPSPPKHSVQQSSEQAASHDAQTLQNPRVSNTEGLSDASNASASPRVRTNTADYEPSEQEHISAGFHLDWSALLHIDARLRAARATATSSSGSTDSSANDPMQPRSAHSRSSPVNSTLVSNPPDVAAALQRHSHLQSTSVSQPEVLRRAQASFADLRRIVQNVLTLGDNVTIPSSGQAAPDTAAPPPAVLAGINQVRTALWSRLAISSQGQSIS